MRPIEGNSPQGTRQRLRAAAGQPVTFTVDVENHRAAEYRGLAGTLPRYQAMTMKLLEFLGARGIRGTFFVEGDVVRAAPDLVRRIAGEGHEIGSHGYRHVGLAHESPGAFREGMAAIIRRLEDVAGTPVLGFRAPGFSLTPASRWVSEILREVGFVYSSSVVPGRALTHGYPGAPTGPFLWPSGLLEIPCPVGRLAGYAVPFQGGMYLRYLPPWRYRSLTAQLGDQVNWTYCHPYDIDVDEPFGRFDGCGWIASLFLWCNRKVLLRRWERLAENPGVPFSELLPELFAVARGLIDHPE